MQEDEKVAFTGITLHLAVGNLDKEVKFFVEKLGFSLLQRGVLGEAALVSRDTVMIHLEQFSVKPPEERIIRATILVTDVERLYRELRGRKLMVRKPIKSVDLYCLDVRTPSGSLLRFVDSKF